MKYVAMSHSVSIFVPQECPAAATADTAYDWRTTFLQYACKNFGGATLQEAQGFYTMSNGTLCEEPVWVITSYHGFGPDSPEIKYLLRMAEEARRCLGQEALGVVIDGTFILVGIQEEVQ